MRKLGAWLRAPFFTPAGFLVRAGALAALYGAATLLGLRDYATILAGSLPYEGASPRLSTVLGLGYVLLYFGWILLVPVFVLAAGFLALWNRRFPGP